MHLVITAVVIVIAIVIIIVVLAATGVFGSKEKTETLKPIRLVDRRSTTERRRDRLIGR